MPTVSKQGASQISVNSTKFDKSPKSAWDLPQRIQLLVYGQSGTGKTTLWATFPKPILALICSGGSNPGELRSIDTPEYRKSITAVVVQSVSQVPQLLEGANNYATVVLDHVSGLQDLFLKETLGIDELPAKKDWGIATWKQWGQSGVQTIECIRTLLNLAGHLVVAAQERVFRGSDEEGVTSDTIDVIQAMVGPSATPSVVRWIHPAFDYICQTVKKPKFKTTEIDVAGTIEKVVEKIPGVDYALRIGPHSSVMTKFRIPLHLVHKVDEWIVNPTYDKLVKATSVK